MTLLTEADLLRQLNWRYATKSFDPSRPLSPRQWDTLKEVLRLSPSSFGLQPWKFISVESPEIRTQLRAASWGQSQVEDASHLVVLTALRTMTEAYVDRYLSEIANVRNVELSSLDGYRQSIVGNLINGPRSNAIPEWAQRQAYIAMGSLMTSAAVLGIDTCPLEGLDPKAYDDILDLTGSPYATIAAVAIGFRSATDKYQHATKVRFDISDVFETK
jgi:nitroreductase